MSVAILRGDSTQAGTLLEMIGNRTSVIAAQPLNVAAWGDFDFGERVARLQTSTSQSVDRQLAGHLNLARILTARGRWVEAEQEIVRAGRMDERSALLAGGTLATLPFLNVPHVDLARLLGQVQAWTPAPAPSRAGPAGAYDRHARLYLLGLLASRLGEYQRAAACADSLRLIPDEAGTAVPANLAATVRADIAWRSGESPDRVLLALDRMSGHVPAILWQDPVFNLGHARYLRAYALLAAGRSDEALNWLLNTFAMKEGAVEYVAGVDYLAARAFDALSRPADAREARAAYERLWARADAPIDLPGSAATAPRR